VSKDGIASPLLTLFLVERGSAGEARNASGRSQNQAGREEEGSRSAPLSFDGEKERRHAAAGANQTKMQTLFGSTESERGAPRRPPLSRAEEKKKKGEIAYVPPQKTYPLRVSAREKERGKEKEGERLPSGLPCPISLYPQEGKGKRKNAGRRGNPRKLACLRAQEGKKGERRGPGHSSSFPSISRTTEEKKKGGWETKSGGCLLAWREGDARPIELYFLEGEGEKDAPRFCWCPVEEKRGARALLVSPEKKRCSRKSEKTVLIGAKRKARSSSTCCLSGEKKEPITAIKRLLPWRKERNRVVLLP